MSDLTNNLIPTGTLLGTLAVGAGTTDYNGLQNKPSINSVTLSGNKTTADLQISYTDLIHKPTIPTLEMHQTQLLLPDTVTINAGSYAILLNNVDIRTLTYSALDRINTITKTLKGCIFLWATGARCYSAELLVNNDKLTLAVINGSNQSQYITTIRLLTFWE